MRDKLIYCMAAMLASLIVAGAGAGSGYSSRLEEDDFSTCLDQHPEPNPKRYVTCRQSICPFTIEVSQRITHLLVSEVYRLFVEEVLGYPLVQFVFKKDNFNATETLQRLAAELDADNNSLPTAMANLELWVPPETNLFSLEIHDHFMEAGVIAPPGRFGWFIPTNHSNILPSMEYYTIFKSPETAKIFSMTDDELGYIIDRSNMRQMFDYDSGQRYNCSQSSDGNACSEGLFTPPWCKGDSNTCAVLLAEEPDESGFVVHHIKSLHLFVKVVWVGKRLEQVIEIMEKLLVNSQKRSFVILTWTPSTLTVPGDKRFITVSFPPCETYAAETGCKYDLHRLVKVMWQPLIETAKPIHDSLIAVHFTRDNYLDLLNRYARRSSGDSVRQVACGWMRNNSDVWTKWLPDNEDNILNIGGIFPFAIKDYRPIGIASAAKMAVDAINSKTGPNRLLRGYKLNLLLTDGKCQPDVVMKTFVDYVFLRKYNQLVGILGPACSDAVEPLAGVSKHYKTVVISYSAEGSKFSDRNKYPYFFRTIGENHQYKYVYLQLLKKLQWYQVASLTQEGTKYAEYISSLHDLLTTNNITFVINRKFPADRGTDAMGKYLTEMKSKSARIIIADIYNGTARDTMCQAYHLDMTAKQGYVWFLPLWLTPEWYDTDKYNRELNETITCSTKQMLEAINGHLGLSFAHYAPDNQIMQENKTVGEWKTEYSHYLSTKYNATPSDYGGYAYDAIWMLAFALDKLMKMDSSFLSSIHNEHTIRRLVEIIEQTDFYGVSGRVKFGKQSSRLSIINIVQWLDNKTHIVGTFHPNDSDPNGGTLFLNVSLIKWLTPDGKRPSDGTDQCIVQWLAEMIDAPCDHAVIILNVVVFVILFFIMLIIFLYLKRRYDKKVQVTREFWKSLGIDLVNPSNMSSLDKWEIPRERVVINRKLGEGAFGFVYGGEAHFGEKGWVAVAVKTLKVGSTTEEKLDFLSEAEVMKRFDHKNIIQLLGVCTKNEPVYTIMEFMLYGDLKTFLLGRRHLVNGKLGEDSDEVSPKKLTMMALDVARALSYLNDLKYVHRDVASRNCLVNAARVVKLGDFGMTRPMFNNDYYKFNRKGMLPVRWMAPESLGLGIFTPSSDVWSYGVLLYEIITFGSFPFQGLSNNQVLEHVKNGNTLKVPPKLKPQLEGLIVSCWNRDPKKRPQASEIVEFLANNPRLLSPCLDVPISSVQLEDTGQLQIQIPEKLRKFSASLRNRSSNSITSQRPSLWRNFSMEDESSSVIWDQPDSPVETLPRITETWTDPDSGFPQNSYTSTNSDRVNVWENPITDRLWTDNNFNNGGIAEPLLGSTVMDKNVTIASTNRNDSRTVDDRYVPLKPSMNSYCDMTMHNEDYCLHNSNAQADSVV